MTQRKAALKNQITPEMKRVAQQENIDAEIIREGIKNGEIVITKNKKHKIEKLCGIGRGLTVKVNTNIGSSPLHMNKKEEIEKLKIAEKYGTDTIMDLSLGALLKQIRKEIIKQSKIPIGTVPVYQVGYELSKNKRTLADMKIDDILKVIREQAEEGVDFMTVHCGVTMETLKRMEREKRVINVVSRGGSMLIANMKKNNKENPMYEYYDKILEIAREYDVTLSLGDGFRPGAVADSTDRSQIFELIMLGELAQRAWDYGVQVMIEGPGHIPLNEIITNIQIQKTICHNAPFYVLGPLVTDISPGYDHIPSAIGGALAAYAGADFLCYMTPSEHLKLPEVSDVKEGVIATRIAAHSADLAKGIPSAVEWDLQMAQARRKLDWEKQIRISIDPEKSKQYRDQSEASKEKVCTMCGEFCAIQQVNEVLGEE